MNRCWAQARASTVQQEREEVCAACKAASFHYLVVEWKDCEELETEAKRDVDLREQGRRGKRGIRRSGVRHGV